MLKQRVLAGFESIPASFSNMNKNQSAWWFRWFGLMMMMMMMMMMTFQHQVE